VAFLLDARNPARHRREFTVDGGMTRKMITVSETLPHAIFYRNQPETCP